MAALLIIISCGGGGGDDSQGGSDQDYNSSDYSKPEIVLIAPTDTNKISIAWLTTETGSTTSNEMKYEVHLSTATNFEPNPSTLYETFTGETQGEIAGLNIGTTYYAIVVAVDKKSNRISGNDYLSATTFTSSVILNNGISYSKTEDLNLGVPSQLDSQYTYSKTEGTHSPKVDSIIFGYDESDEMYMRKVDSVQTMSTEIVVETSDSSLSDLIDRGQVSSSINLFDVAGTAKSISKQRSNIRARNAIRDDQSRYSSVTWKDKLLEAEQIDYAHTEDDLVVRPSNIPGSYSLKSGEVSEEVSIDADVKFTPKLKTDIAWDVFGDPIVKSGTVVAQGTLAFDIDAKYNFNDGYTYEKEFDLFAKGWRSVYSVGPVPVYQRVALKVKAVITAIASAAIEASTYANASATVNIGVSYNGANGQWEPIFSENFSKSLTAKLDILGGVKAEIRLVPEIEVKFYRIVAASIIVEPYLKGEIAVENITNADLLIDDYTFITQPTKFDSELNLDCFAEVNLTVLAKNIPILGKTALCNNPCFSYPLFSLPALELRGESSVETGQEALLNAIVTNGTNNNFDLNSIEWKVYPDTATVTIDSSNPLNATFKPYELGDYIIFFSGNSSLGSLSRQFAQHTLTVVDSALGWYVGNYEVFPHEPVIDPWNDDEYIVLSGTGEVWIYVFSGISPYTGLNCNYSEFDNYSDFCFDAFLTGIDPFPNCRTTFGISENYSFPIAWETINPIEKYCLLGGSDDQYPYTYYLLYINNVDLIKGKSIKINENTGFWFYVERRVDEDFINNTDYLYKGYNGTLGAEYVGTAEPDSFPGVDSFVPRVNELANCDE